MVWFRRAVQPVQDSPLQTINPLFQTPSEAQLSVHGCTGQQQAFAEEVPVVDTEQPATLRPTEGQEGPTWCPPAPSLHKAAAQLFSGPPQRSAASSRGHSSMTVNTIRAHAPSVLVLPCDEPLGSLGASPTGVAAACCTPGTVGSNSPKVALHVPAGQQKPPKAAAAASTPDAQAFGLVVSPADCTHHKQHALSSQPSPAATGAAKTAVDHSKHPIAAGGSPTCCGSSKAAAAAHHVHGGTCSNAEAAEPPPQPPDAEDADGLLADLCQSLSSLQVAAGLARTESRMGSSKLPAAVAAVRASLDETNSRGGSTRSSSSWHGSRQPSATQAETAGTATPAVPGDLMQPGPACNKGRSSSGAGSLSSASPARAASGNTCINSTLSASTSSGGVNRQLVRGRSRLQTSISNACLLADATAYEFEDSDEEPLEAEQYSQVGAAKNSSSTNSPTGSQVLQKSGKPGCPAAACRSGSSSRRCSAGSSSSSRKDTTRAECSSISSNTRSSLEVATLNQSAVQNPSKAGVSSYTVGPPAVALPKTPKSKSNEQSQQAAQQKLLQLQQEQQLHQERREKKQELVVASYSCIGPQSPHRSARQSLSSAASNKSSGTSRPCTGKDAAVQQHKPMPGPPAQPIAADAWAVPVPGGLGAACGAADSVLESPCAAATPAEAVGSLADVWASIQAGSPNTPGSACGVQSTSFAGGLVGGGGSVVLSKNSSGRTGVLRASASALPAMASGSEVKQPQPPSARALSAGVVPSPRGRGATVAFAGVSGVNGATAQHQ